jgi:hypothetical protein
MDGAPVYQPGSGMSEDEYAQQIGSQIDQAETADC